MGMCGSFIMIELIGDFWEITERENPDAICCTTNQILNKNNCLVMGKGIAKQFSDKYSFLPVVWGEQFKKGSHLNGFMVYNYKPFLIAFPTKTDWKLKSNLNLIKVSCFNLKNISLIMGWKCVLLPRPGCSNGGLNWNEVKPVVEEILNKDIFKIITNGN